MTIYYTLNPDNIGATAESLYEVSGGTIVTTVPAAYGSNLAYVTSPTEHDAAVQFNLALGDMRSEIVPLGFTTAEFEEGSQTWTYESWYLPVGMDMNGTNGNLLGQWHSQPSSGSPLLSLNAGLVSGTATWFVNANTQDQKFLPAITFGVFTHFVWRTVWSTVQARSLVDIWMNGVHVVSGWQPIGATLAAGTTVSAYPQVGCYLSNATGSSAARHCILADYRIASTMREAVGSTVVLASSGGRLYAATGA